MKLKVREGIELEIDFYGKVRNLYVKEECDEFNVVLEVFLLNVGKLYYNDKNFFFNYLLNFIIWKGNVGYLEYIKDSFKFY